MNPELTEFAKQATKPRSQSWWRRLFRKLGIDKGRIEMDIRAPVGGSGEKKFDVNDPVYDPNTPGPNLEHFFPPRDKS